jgi:8-oxo-dGTP diphosphatase
MPGGLLFHYPARTGGGLICANLPGDVTIIVDVANVMGARADGWWKDRAGAALRLCREVAALAGRGLSAADVPGSAGPDAMDPGLAQPDAGQLPGARVTGPPEARRYPVWVLVLEGRAREAADSLPLAQAEASPPTGGPVNGGPATGGSVNRQGVADSAGLVQVVLAPGSGDDAIARQAAELRGCCIVVTADRELRRRCEGTGAIVTGPRWLLRLL